MRGPEKTTNVFLSGFHIKLLLIFIVLYFINCVFISIVLINIRTFLFLDFASQFLRYLEHYRRYLFSLEINFKFHQKVELMKFQNNFILQNWFILKVLLIIILITKRIKNFITVILAVHWRKLSLLTVNYEFLGINIIWIAIIYQYPIIYRVSSLLINCINIFYIFEV